MHCETTTHPELFIISPKIHQDPRGYFFESYREDQIPFDFHCVQENQSLSSQNTLRGLHYQIPPLAQTKLIRVVKGKIFDVAVDLRVHSPYFKKAFWVELSAENQKQFLIPKGFAHGFYTLSKEAIIVYKVDAYYAPEYERTIFWNSQELDIPWPCSIPNLSERDNKAPTLNFQKDLFHEKMPCYW